MRRTTADLHSALGTRLSNLCEWLKGALEVGELRSPESVRLAKESFLQWTRETWDGDGGDTEGALIWGLEGYVENCVAWADGSSSLSADLFLSATEPAWEPAEFHLLVASLLADEALLAFKRGTRRQMMLAAMLYADAVDCREHWDKMRGPGGARNPNTPLGRAHAAGRAVEERIVERRALSQRARRAIKAKLNNDPKQAAKTEAYLLWQRWQAGTDIHASGAAFARYVVEQTAIEDTNSVQRWMRKWRNDHRRNP